MTLIKRSAIAATLALLASACTQTATRTAELLPFEPETVAIAEGDFLMGSPANEAGHASDEGPQHAMHIKAFRMGKTEVTFAQYDAFAEATGRKKPADEGWGRGTRPVINVSWQDAYAYSQWLSEKTGKRYRLPTEAEWEYAARAGTTTPFYTGNCISTQQANYHGNWFDYNHCGAKTGTFLEKTQPVAHYAPNAWGLYDMAGNVWEWTCSGYTKQGYNGEESSCNIDTKFSFSRAARGGSWFVHPSFLRSASRLDGRVLDSRHNLGFRLAQDL